MALRDPLWLENAGAVYNAGEYRRLLESLFIRGGVVSSADLAVSQSSPVGMKVAVAAGTAIVTGSESSVQGKYHVANDAAVDVTIAAADVSLPRIDRIGIRIRDDEYSGVAHTGTLVAEAGTPNASPVAPTAPANFLTLATVAVAAGASSITNANITDARVRTAPGLRVICTSTTRPTGFQGLSIYETDTGRELVYYGATTGWQPPWANPWGVLAFVTTTTATNGITAEVDLNSLTTSVTFIANRRYRISVEVTFFKSTTDMVRLLIYSAGVSVNGAGILQVIPTTKFATLHGMAVIAPTAGVTTVKLRASSDGGTVDAANTTTSPKILIEDIGPATPTPPAA